MRENTPLNAYRCAIYYAPDPHEPLAILGRNGWVGIHMMMRHILNLGYPACQ